MKHLTLRRFLWNKRALGAPVGNLIILVAAVVLSTTVVLFAVNVTSNQVQKENLSVAGATLDMEKAEVTIMNTGPTSIRITQLTIKGDRFTNYTSSPDIGTGLSKGNSTTLTVPLTPNLITINDVGRPITIVISTTQGVYFTETLVQATQNATST
jgi:hypothetical protein